VWRRILRDPAAAAAAFFLFIIVAAAIFAPLIAPYDPYTNNMRLRFCPPLCVTAGQVDDMLEILGEVIADVGAVPELAATR